MKEGWEYKALGELCHKFNGLWKGKKEPFIRVGVIRNANFTKAFTLDFSNIEYLDVEQKQYASRKLIPGDLIVEKSGGSEKQPVGRAVLFDKEDGEYSFSNFTSVLRIKNQNEITPEFLYKHILYVYLRGDTKSMQKATTGIHNIEFEKYLSIKIPIPPLSEQQEIVEYLDSSFAKIDALKANAAKNLEEAKSLFQSALKEALEPKEGWEEKKLGEMVKDVRYGTSKPSCVNGTYTYLRMNNITSDGHLELNDTKTISLDEKELEKCIVRKGDILFNRTNSYEHVGKTCVFTEETPMVIAGYIIRIRLQESLNPYYMSYFFNMKETKEKLRKLSVGAVHQSNINAKAVQTVLIPLPPLSEQQSIVSHLDSLNEKVNTLQQNYSRICNECDALKQAILRQVFE